MSDRHDFDFLHGEWLVHNRRRTDFLDPDSGWEEFPATSRCLPLFGGAANLDEIDLPHLGFQGLTLRLFEPVRRTWALHWSSSTTGTLFPPVVGRFENGLGHFHGDDTHDGKDVRVRFVWSGISADTAHWEQAFSVDGGRTWLSNWTMAFSRPASGTPAG
ncbi:hypothetical protein [Streptomyces antibioticus]|uniref:hypothetical protein n=1 Tax=Streptomyces antibioticus TaxID=1890 RepID=UPI002250AACB|nr:hypothetical protein [Streptomyces antibioticus]MCX4742093.1 hypothetical protein [Streptomyces antibioticus]